MQRFRIRIIMNKIITSCFLVVIIFLVGCQNNVNPYENKMGIPPGVYARLDTANYTTVEWKDSVSNFGKIQEGDTTVLKYRFVNSGDKLLFLVTVQPSCGCTITSYPQEAILPGKSGVLTATFKSKGHPGVIHKTIAVTTNTKNQMSQLLVFNGEVLSGSRQIP
ncbi:MAG: hypothetical protein JWN76_3400 [Chitinophagaceae bacterium]|nr:hypothetical protein [Chitinophagaceae bacterium]